ncbi:four-carbon acid sugar kinase family protein [Microbacterium galbinum]|uniref:four-carbon acid sugar kinase family protein n=1 Tax=Microbacterium galbinum TaxID=2851646 RepID=UPI001FFDBB70|nr:four-carbon acid sugar kinase family protein [Microbacterium galbinum]
MADSPLSPPAVGYYGDDVTGSVDVLLQFARHGVRGCLFIGTPSDAALADAAGSHEVVGIAGIARSLSPDALDAEVRPALTALRDLSPRIVQYKACSTADSSPTVGSLGRVLEIGREVFGSRTVPVLFAQPDFGRYTVFGHHFAAEGGTVHRLDRQPTMSQHPSTPMDDSDLAAHLSRQTPLPIDGVPLTRYSTASSLAAEIDGSPTAALVLDAIDDAHLALIGTALEELSTERHPLFAIGSGGLSRALALGRPASALADERTAGGPVLAVSGSRSPQTRRQIAAAQAAGWAVRPLSPDADAQTEVVALLRAGRSVALSSEDAPAFAGHPEVLAAIADAATSVIRGALGAGATRRLIVCGGDTSSRVVRSLGIASLSIAANPGANVVVLRARSDDPSVDGVEVLLKGGQVGDDGLFEAVRGGAR